VPHNGRKSARPHDFSRVKPPDTCEQLFIATWIEHREVRMCGKMSTKPCEDATERHNASSKNLREGTTYLEIHVDS
jgi:hypothetical protein